MDDMPVFMQYMTNNDEDDAFPWQTLEYQIHTIVIKQ